MANPKCGTCRFFQENDLPGSGWCHHPQRKVSSDVKILVRRSELACRDDWSRSLWQPATGGTVADAAAIRPAGTGPLLPASPESLRAVLNRDLAVSASAGEDVLLSEGRIISENQEPWEPPRPFPAGNFDPRTAIFKAREAYREKLRANAMASRQSAAETNAGAFDRVDTGPERGETGEEGVWAGSAGAARQDSARDEQEPPEPAAILPTEGVLEASAAPSPGDRAYQGEPQRETWSPAASAMGEEIFSEGDKEGDVCAAEAPAISDDASFSLEAPRSVLATELPAWFRADLPRVCRACRDFRPGTDGERGWCASAWAFTHRQLVLEDDVAPCHSAIGDWWVPVDDVWLVAADVSSHGRATPLLDRMIAAESAGRRRS